MSSHHHHHLVPQVFRPHRHDAVDSIDAALESDQRGIRAVKISFLALMVTGVVQVVIVASTGSVALLADTVHNFADALTAIPLFIAFRLGRRPANQRYTYGYRRAEDLAGLFVLAVIATSAVVAAWQAIDRLINPRDVDNLGMLVGAGLAGFVGNELVAVYRIRRGQDHRVSRLGRRRPPRPFRRIHLAWRRAGHHQHLGRLLRAGADPIVGLAISIAIFAVLRDATIRVYHRLMDAIDPVIVERINNEAGHTPAFAL